MFLIPGVLIKGCIIIHQEYKKNFMHILSSDCMVSSIYRCENLRFYELKKKVGDKVVSFPFRQRPPKTHLYLTWVGLFTCFIIDSWDISLRRELEITCLKICLGLGDLGEVLRKWGFILPQGLRRSRSNSMIRYLNTFYLESEKKWSEVTVLIGGKAVDTPVSQDRRIYSLFLW